MSDLTDIYLKELQETNPVYDIIKTGAKVGAVAVVTPPVLIAAYKLYKFLKARKAKAKTQEEEDKIVEKIKRAKVIIQRLQDKEGK